MLEGIKRLEDEELIISRVPLLSQDKFNLSLSTITMINDLIHP
ncbi:hypothetical protein LTSEADE_1876 [Salmonella enterica subsp. enterica serovar Adelaide str. A4-669]|uniref:Uncharacterized protein n=1 Tax=Salmonella enterica subsp. enterica serovar Adelaide str. A4-669 TaxID=913063 RepID=A0A6C8GQ17_SALET|nr:hypothetical protein LTSEADE_1876 [Salmonella enterica subsp. enterica serovar Adelaide str. A4-669]